MVNGGDLVIDIFVFCSVKIDKNILHLISGLMDASVVIAVNGKFDNEM